MGLESKGQPSACNLFDRAAKKDFLSFAVPRGPHQISFFSVFIEGKSPRGSEWAKHNIDERLSGGPVAKFPTPIQQVWVLSPQSGTRILRAHRGGQKKVEGEGTGEGAAFKVGDQDFSVQG